MVKDCSIIGVVRPSLLGDIIASLPFSTYLHKVYPNSFQTAYIDKKCSQIIPFLINHPLIDKIQISDKIDKVSENDEELFKTYDLVFNPFPQITRPDYYNHHHITKELFMMNEIYGIDKRIAPSEWDKLSREEKIPKFTQWFDTERQNKTIAIWPFSGYNKDSISQDLRSPTKQWWNNLIKLLPDYKILQFGHPNSESLDDPSVTDCRKMSLFDAIKLSLGCECVIGTDSGSQWIVGAYGHPQVCLFTNYMEDHNSNITAFLPTNYKNNQISILGKNKNINNINQELVLESIKKLI